VLFRSADPLTETIVKQFGDRFTASAK